MASCFIQKARQVDVGLGTEFPECMKHEMASQGRPALQGFPGQRRAQGVSLQKVTLTYLSWARVLTPTPKEPLTRPSSPSSMIFPNCPVWMQAPGSAPRRGAASQSSRKGPLPEDEVNRLSLKVTSSGSGSSGQRKLQSFFRAVNAKRKMHWVTAFLHAPGQWSAFSQGISLPNKASFFSAWTQNRPRVTFA